MQLAYLPYSDKDITFTGNTEDNPAPPSPGIFDGAMVAAPLGVAKGLALTAQFLQSADDGEQTAGGPTGVYSAEKGFYTPLPKDLAAQFVDRAVEATSLRPGEQGMAAQFIHGTASFVTRATLGSMVGGPIGSAANLGGTTFNERYNEQAKLGVDNTTNLITSTLAGATDAVFGAVPMAPIMERAAASFLRESASEISSPVLNSLMGSFASGFEKVAASAGANRVSSALYGAGLNVVMGAASRGAISTVFHEGGYDEMAAQYAALDGSSLAADAVLGLAFGFLHHNGKDVSNDPSAVPPTVLEHAVDMARTAQNVRGGVGIPSDHISVGLDATNRDTAMDSLQNGTPYEIDSQQAQYLNDHTLPDPQRNEIIQQSIEALKSHVEPEGVGLLEPVPDPVLPEVIFEPPMPDIPVEGGERYPLVKQMMNPIELSNIDQIARSTPDAMIESPDGTMVRAADYMDHLEKDLAETNKEADLYDVGIACFLRTE